jgi:hypothetical protein
VTTRRITPYTAVHFTDVYMGSQNMSGNASMAGSKRLQ